MILSPGKDALNQCIDILNRGGLVGVPTETVYGLAADATSDQGVSAIYEAKNRPDFNPLIVHGHTIEMLESYVIFNDQARQLATQFWPGPLTMVLPRQQGTDLSLLVSAGLDTVAVRIPKHPVMLELLTQFKKPLSAPSANPSGTISPTTAQHVADGLGDKVDAILDGGACDIGVESTIIDMTTNPVTILRHGGISLEDLRQCLGEVAENAMLHIKAPGMMASHYAPSIPVRLNVVEPREGEAYLGFGDCGECTLNLSNSGDLQEAAANLFRMMRLLDQELYSGMAIAPIPERGLGRAINDRIRRAAAE